MSKTPDWVEAVARILLGGLFLLEAGRGLIHPGHVMRELIAAGVPGVPATFVVGLTLILIGSLGLILGYRTRTACISLGIVLLVQILFLYPPWNLTATSGVPLLSRVGILGGLLLILFHGPGPISFDAHKLVPVRRKL